MSYTKRQFITGALEEIAVSSYDFDVSPEELQSALRRLDGMMAEWNGSGVSVGYPLPSSPSASSLDDETGVPDWANEAIILGLAVRIAPSFGRVATQDTKAAALRAKNMVDARLCQPQTMQYPDTMPNGAGNKRATVFQQPEVNNVTYN